jgi:predicted metal-dependent hydrolase
MSAVASIISGLADLAVALASIEREHGESAAKAALAEAMAALSTARARLYCVEADEDKRLEGLPK